MTRPGVIAIFISLAHVTTASGQQTIRNTLSFGVGSYSCAKWTSENDAFVKTWILGDWTGLNLMNQRRHDVGESTDGEGIISEVRAGCASQPSERIFDVESTAYAQMVARENAR